MDLFWAIIVIHHIYQPNESMFTEQKTISIAGEAGYIGSSTVIALKQSGYTVLILDNLIYGHRDLVGLQIPLIVGIERSRTQPYFYKLTD